MTTHNRAHPHHRNAKVAAYLMWMIAAMVVVTFAAVPLYKLYVKVTGYGGIAQSADAAPSAVLKRKVTVEFDSNTAPNLPWSFKPAQGSETIRIGAQGVARFHVQNNAKAPVAAVASFNIVPFAAAAYFETTQCFCFVKQTLAPGEAKDISVSYFVDPAFAKDGQLDGVKTLTLSYTFFRRDDLVVDK